MASAPCRIPFYFDISLRAALSYYEGHTAQLPASDFPDAARPRYFAPTNGRETNGGVCVLTKADPVVTHGEQRAVQRLK